MTADRGTVLIVGGASGIGLAAAARLGADGYSIALADIDGERLREACHALQLAGVRASSRRVNVLDVADIEACVSHVASGGDLAGLVNTAGIYQKGTAADVTEQDWDRLIDINLKGTFFTCRAVLPHLVARGGGSIVNLASQSGRTKSQYSAPNYSTSKAGVIGLSMTLAAQHGSSGVRVNAVAPGIVETPMTAGQYSTEENAAMLRAIPLGRFARPDEMASIIAFLISDDSSYVTGHTINANGGAWMI